MTTYHNDTEYRAAYEHKKQQAENRFIPFLFTFEEFKVLLRIRNNSTCAYTNQRFHIKGGHKYSASMERIDGEKPYCKENVVWVTVESNSLKNNHIELNKPMKGLDTNQIGLVHRIKKILSDPNGIEKMMTPYTELYKKYETAATATHKANMEELEKQKVVLAKQKDESDKKEKLEMEVANKKRGFEAQRDLATWYARNFNGFAKLEVLFEVSLKDCRDMLRITRCKITGHTFEDIYSKYIFVIDKTLPLTKSNCLIVTKSTQESLDYLCGGDIMVLKKSATNLVKVLLNVEK